MIMKNNLMSEIIFEALSEHNELEKNENIPNDAFDLNILMTSRNKNTGETKKNFINVAIVD